MQSDRPRLIRILILVAIALAVEGAVFLFGYLAPALAGLTGPVYWVVAAFFAVAIWHDTRQRARKDRRHGERRDPPS
jgi:hypothetical protein